MDAASGDANLSTWKIRNPASKTGHFFVHIAII